VLWLMFDFASQAIFPTHAVAAAGPLPRGAERLQIQTDDGKQLHGVHVPPARRAAGPKTLILGFAGNAWNSQDAATYLHQIYPGADVVAFHYRGYRPSSGNPSAAALLADAPLIHDQLTAMLKPDRVVAVGFSVGSGIAARLARLRRLEGVILVTPFDSLRAVAKRHYPWLPIGLLFRNEMPAAEDLRGSNVPVGIIAAGKDTLIPPARAAALARAVPNLVFERTIASAGHNDIYDRGEFRTAMAEALRQILLAGQK
jgi:pimeloyl-ACP methyl ester carboxylesterase